MEFLLKRGAQSDVKKKLEGQFSSVIPLSRCARQWTIHSPQFPHEGTLRIVGYRVRRGHRGRRCVSFEVAMRADVRLKIHAKINFTLEPQDKV